VPGFVDGRPAAFVRDPNDVAGRTTYIVLLEWAEDRVLGIRDFRFARYITDGDALLVAD
jgi:RNA polymerase sigma-70 factor (ECF subfamily)